MKEKIFRYGIRLFFLVSIATVISTILITLAWTIPNKYIEQNAKYGSEILRREGGFFPDGTPDYEYLFTHGWGSRVDAMNDHYIFERAVSKDEEKSALYNAFYCAGDLRYWNGLNAFIRPFCVVATYAQFRYMMGLAIGILLWLILKKTAQRLGDSFAIAFLLSMLVMDIIIVPYNMIHGMATIIYMGSVVWVLYKYNDKTKNLQIFTVFGLFAIFNLFFEKITVLPQSIGMPLMFILFIDQLVYGRAELRENVKKMIVAGAGWLSAFLSYWIMNFLLKSIIIHKNILKNATDRVIEYAQPDNPNYPPGYRWGRIYCLEKNLASLIPSRGEALPFISVCAGIVLIVAVVFWIRSPHKLGLKEIFSYLPEAIIGFGLPFGLFMGAPYLCISNATTSIHRCMVLSVFFILAIFFKGVWPLKHSSDNGV